MRQILLISLVIMSVSLASSLPIYVKPLLPDGSLQPSLIFPYTFNFTTASDCTGVVLSNSTNISTGKDGVGFIDIDVSGMSSIPSYLCEYRSGSLRKVHTLSDLVARMLYASGANFTGNISADWINAKLNYSYIRNAPTNLSQFTDDLPPVNLTNYYFKNETYNSSEINSTFVPYNGAIQTVDLGSQNATTTGWFKGIFNWVVNALDGSSNYLSFNGTSLSQNETKINATIGSYATTYNYTENCVNSTTVILGGRAEGRC